MLARIRQIDIPFVAILCMAAFLLIVLAATAKAETINKSPNTRGPIVKNPVATVATPAKGWTGIWVGGHLGYGVVQQHAVDSVGDAFNTFDVSTAQDAVLYGLGVGFDLQLGKYVVVGVLTDHSWTNSKRHIAIPVGDSIANDPAVGDVDISRLWYAGGRLGWLAHPKALLFGSVGYTSVYGDTTLGDKAAATAPGILGDRGGVTYGAGIEVHAESGFGLKLEYRFVDLRNDPLKYGAAVGQLADIDSHMHQVMLSANFKFDSPIK